MGMFDYVDFECECPLCGAKVNSFQSKDGLCNLNKLEFWKVNNFYTACEKCGIWIEFTFLGRKNEKLKIEDYLLNISNCFYNLKEAKEYFKEPKKVYKKLQKKKIQRRKRK